MDLSRYIHADTLLANLEPSSKQQVIGDMLSVLVGQQGVAGALAGRAGQIEADILAREEVTPTCLGEGVAFPHLRVEGLPQLMACMAILSEPLEWGLEDGFPVDVICLYLVPLDDPTAGVRFMGALAELLGDNVWRDYLRKGRGAGEIIEFIRSKQLMVDRAVIASDIMQPEEAEIHPRTPLKTVTRTMLTRRTDALPVCDEDRRVVGEINCDSLYRKGIPDFFQQLASVSFIRDFDPFESYFAEEAQSVAADVMAEASCCVGPDETLLEILFALTVQDFRRLYVVRDPETDPTLLGAIDRITVLDRVIHE